MGGSTPGVRRRTGRAPAPPDRCAGRPTPESRRTPGARPTREHRVGTDQRGERERLAMRRAVALSASVGEATHPNPNVGAVVLDRAGAVVGEGCHQRAGGKHAEVVALAEAGDRARGGTVLVTLEPCAHTGRTGPCTDALLAAGVARVVYAVPEPTELASGGAGRLRDAGVDVVLGVERAAAEDGALASWLT